MRAHEGDGSGSTAAAGSRRERLALPETIEVVLSPADGRPSIQVRDDKGSQWTIKSAGTAVVVNGDAQLAKCTLEGPVWIGGARHDGWLTVEPHPRGGLRAYVSLSLETYVAGVVAAELSLWSATSAELEAQAIAARTFAAAELIRRRDSGLTLRLTDGVLDQAYRGTYDAAGSRGALDAGARLRSAVEATAGRVLLRGDRFEEARYHASCGGHTANFADVFASEAQGRGAVGPDGILCAPCGARAHAEAAAGAPATKRPLSWSYDVPPGALEGLGRGIGLGGAPTRVASAAIDAGGRWLSVTFERGGSAVTVPFDRVRAALGYSDLKSALVTAMTPRAGAPIQNGKLQISGRGRGHGVGLCQESARDLAQAGWSAERILTHYYGGARIVQLASLPTASSRDAQATPIEARATAAASETPR